MSQINKYLISYCTNRLATQCITPLLHRTLDAELEPVLLSKATHFGLPAEWVSRLDKLDPERRQV